MSIGGKTGSRKFSLKDLSCLMIFSTGVCSIEVYCYSSLDSCTLAYNSSLYLSSNYTRLDLGSIKFRNKINYPIKTTIHLTPCSFFPPIGVFFLSFLCKMRSPISSLRPLLSFLRFSTWICNSFT